LVLRQRAIVAVVQRSEVVDLPRDLIGQLPLHQRDAQDGGKGDQLNGCIFLINGDQSLVEMREEPYSSEDLLQGLLAKYPNLLAGDQMGGAEPRRWLLILP
jgi:hypothetical protein